MAPEQRTILDGVARTISFATNPHKCFFTPMDWSAFYTRRPDGLKRAFSLLPEYLRSSETDANAVIDYMDYGVQLGRRFRALKLWFVLRAYGQEGLVARLREHIRLAQVFGGWVDDAPDFERLAPTPLSTVCCRAQPRGLDDPAQLEALNERLMTAVNATGLIFISHTKLNGRYTLRLAVGNIRTAESHVRQAWELLQEKLGELTS